MNQPTDDTPSVTPVGRDSSLREGAGNGCVPFNVPPGNREVAGDFHRPYETQKFLHSAIHRGTLPQSASLTAPSGREPGWGAYHSTCRSETARLRAIFIAPTELKSFYILPFIGGHSLREGAGVGCVPFSVPPGKREVAGDFHRPYENSECFTFYHSTAPGF